MTNSGNTPNNINVLSSDVVITCSLKLGITSEIVLAPRKRKYVISLSDRLLSQQFFTGLSEEIVLIASSPKRDSQLTSELIENL
nr:hypothetical protein [cyanobacterium endosymbiont of Rhopalodia gibberula]